MCHSQLIAVGTAAHHDDVGVGKIERLAHADLVQHYLAFCHQSSLHTLSNLTHRSIKGKAGLYTDAQKVK